jgi:hypothetical protein
VHSYAAQSDKKTMSASDQVDAMTLSLRNDIGLVATGLIRAFGLSFKKTDSDPHIAITRWLDFRFRYVEPVPRVVSQSDQFPKTTLPEPTKRALDQLVQRFESGENVNPYQGRSLKGRKISASQIPPRFRTDLLFADWGISHFHLTDEPMQKGQKLSKRSGWLAFCIVTPSEVAFVDVVKHPGDDNLKFADPALLSTAIRSWPRSFDHLRVNRVTPDSSLTMTKIHALRQNHTNAFYNYDGDAYMGPGGGLMANGTLAHAYRTTMVLERHLDSLSKSLVDPFDQFRGHLHLKDVGQPEFSMRVHAGGLGIYERVSKTLFGKVSDDSSQDAYGLRWMSDLLIPVWAMTQVIESKTTIFDDLFCEEPGASLDRR